MYTSFFNFQGRPFQLTPDPRFFFEGRPHRKAVAYLTYGLAQREGFVVITGDVGTGKTILVDYLFSKLQRESFVTGKVVTTLLEADNLLRMVADAFGIETAVDDKAAVLKGIKSFLIAAHQRNIRPLLIIDEVQNLSKSSLEELRMLSNFQLGELPLLQIFLVGQPQFRQTMASGGLEQLGQRIIASHHLWPLDADETRKYIEHRLHHVGWSNDPVVTDEAFERVYAETGGVPRRVNLLFDRLLLFAYLEGTHEITNSIVSTVLEDMRSEGLPGALERSQSSREHSGSSEDRITSSHEDDLEGLSVRIADIENLLKQWSG